MAGPNCLSVHVPLGYRNSKLIGQQEREDLEREVSVLQEVVDYDEMVPKYRESLLYRQDDSALSIRNSLPPKMTELLEELAMVQTEINRLESRITALHREKQENVGSNLNKREHETRGNIHESSSPLAPECNSSSRRPDEKVPFEIKALHFISRAIRGDYYKPGDFSINERNMNSKRFSGHTEKSSFLDQGGTFREKVLKRSGMLKHPSPSRPRHQTPARNSVLDIPSDSLPKAVSTPLHSEADNIHQWPPNKLSENIMKYLIFIFMRLLRTSRATELEKPRPIAHSTNISLSFRAETSPNSKSGLIFQKDSRQQDPYGIFESRESIPRDIGPYKNLVRFTSSSLDFNCMQNSGFLPLFQKLKILMDGLQKVDLRFLSHRQKLAFWINMYNACIMHGYLQYGIPSVSSPEKMLALINQATLNIAGHSINAQTIERFILRKPSDSLEKQIFHSKEMTIHELYGLKTPDPNIAFALCCGTRSSPAVKIYTAEGVTAELERSKLEYLQASIMVTSTKRMAIPELLLRNMRDFGQDVGSLMEWLCHQLPGSGCLRKSIMDCFRGLHGGKTSAVVEMIPYLFEFQYLFAI